MVAPAGLDPAAFPLADGGADLDLFGWPNVLGERNVRGPLAIAVPGAVDGFALALERFGTLAWSAALAPAIALARQGHPGRPICLAGCRRSTRGWKTTP
jgi:gamma-glutamyltranspeptidase/glutathione hydrolase